MKSKDHPTRRRNALTAVDVCNNKKCIFYNKKPQQGVCHTTDSVASQQKRRVEIDYVKSVEAYAARCMDETHACMKELFKRSKKKPTLKNKYDFLCIELEAQWANSGFRLDELVMLRAFRSEALALLKDPGQTKWDKKRVALLKKYKED